MLEVIERVRRSVPVALSGSVGRTLGLVVAARGFPAPLGALCEIQADSGEAIEAEVIGFDHQETLLIPLGRLSGIRPGSRVQLSQSVPTVAVGAGLLGRVVDARGRVRDGLPAPSLPHRITLESDAISPLERPPIESPLGTGVRAIDGMLSCGRGQRLGIFAGSGVGKSTLLGQMARCSDADVTIVTLVGERGREVREFIDRDLGPEGLQRSIVVSATSDEPAIMRVRAAMLGASLAEYFRDQGKDVLLLMDSVTRVALAQREIGLAAGEPPATRGFPPSVFALLPSLLERSGCTSRGSITGFFTVLVEGDDTTEPIADSVRGILDGHIMLSRPLAERGHWPAIDIASSVSRVMPSIVESDHLRAANCVREHVAVYRQSESLVSVGAYVPGTRAELDQAIEAMPRVEQFLRQPSSETCSWSQNLRALSELCRSIGHPAPTTHSSGDV